MSTDWVSRLKAAWRGEVSGADLGAALAATASLAGLQQALQDRRLAAEIEQAGTPWRASLAVGQIAAPLWLANTLVDLAGAFYDAEAQAHPDRPDSVSPATHDLVTALLAPVEDLAAAVTAMLADPNQRPALTAPVRVGPGGGIANIMLPDLIPIPYARGLATGARRTHTTAASALAALQGTLGTSPTPDWLIAGTRRLDGELQAAGARLDMVEVRLGSLLVARGAEPATLAAACNDLWEIVGSAMVAGQQVADPHLLPEARAAGAERHVAPGSAWSAPAHPSPAPPAPRPTAAPAHPAHRLPAVSLPEVGEGGAAVRPKDGSSAAPTPAPAPPPPVSLPSIGGDAAPSPATHTGGETGSGMFPSIGEEATPPAPRREPPATRPAPAREDDGQQPLRLPEIG